MHSPSPSLRILNRAAGLANYGQRPEVPLADGVRETRAHAKALPGAAAQGAGSH